MIDLYEYIYICIYIFFILVIPVGYNVYFLVKYRPKGFADRNIVKIDIYACVCVCVCFDFLFFFKLFDSSKSSIDERSRVVP